ncbi:MAG: DUF4252 domain-containing protein [Bacteroidales bacterium]|nr:DUF4252 domain-containing protein [Bacteroidales bacterium]
MKKLVLILVIALAPAFLFAQNSAVEKLFKKYGGQDGFTTITLNSGLLKMAAEFTDDDEDLEVLKQINSIKILVQEDGTADNFYDEIMGKLKRDSYEELMTVNSEDEDVIFLIKKNGDTISEFLLIASGEDENVLVYIGGSLRMKDLAKLGSSINMEGASFAHLEHLSDLEK